MPLRVAAVMLLQHWLVDVKGGGRFSAGVEVLGVARRRSGGDSGRLQGRSQVDISVSALGWGDGG